MSEINPGDGNVAAVWAAERQRAAGGWMALMAFRAGLKEGGLP